MVGCCWHARFKLQPDCLCTHWLHHLVCVYSVNCQPMASPAAAEGNAPFIKVTTDGTEHKASSPHSDRSTSFASARFYIQTIQPTTCIRSARFSVPFSWLQRFPWVNLVRILESGVTPLLKTRKGKLNSGTCLLTYWILCIQSHAQHVILHCRGRIYIYISKWLPLQSIK